MIVAPGSPVLETRLKSLRAIVEAHPSWRTEIVGELRREGAAIRSCIVAYPQNDPDEYANQAAECFWLADRLEGP